MSTPVTPPQGAPQTSAASIEYSAREVCPPALIRSHLLRAHQIFLLHQAPSIAQLYSRIPRTKFCGLLKRFWDSFISTWDVLLHGNPGGDIFNGIKLAAGGELGIGVGEEEWGSGERDVLEGFVGRTEGLVDLIVSRFGDAPQDHHASAASSSLEPSSQESCRAENMQALYPGPSDGIIFSGVGALARSSIRDIASWVEWLHTQGHNTYGVRDNPSSVLRQKRKKAQEIEMQTCPSPFGPTPGKESSQSGINVPLNGKPTNTANGPIHIPPPIVRPNGNVVDDAKDSTVAKQEVSTPGQSSNILKSAADASSSTETFVKYLTLGVYGSAWGIPAGRPVPSQQSGSLKEEADRTSKPVVQNRSKRNSASALKTGHFLIGLQSDVEEAVQGERTELDIDSGGDGESLQQAQNSNDRIVVRTLHVKRSYPVNLEREKRSNSGGDLAGEEVSPDRVRVIVYVQPPFIFTLLFELETASLTIPSFYRSLHHQLGPLQRPLLASTSPTRVAERLGEVTTPKSTAATASTLPIYDLVFDPGRLTVHTTIENIPEPRVNQSDSSAPLPWTRIEALSVHSQILNTYASTRQHPSELERTCKTSRGWWVVWISVPQGSVAQNHDHDQEGYTYSREAFLIRKASDYIPAEVRKPGSRSASEGSGLGAFGAWGPGKLAEGIGIDARQYIDGLLSLNR